jgi:hypothetical protein
MAKMLELSVQEFFKTIINMLLLRGGVATTGILVFAGLRNKLTRHKSECTGRFIRDRED